MKLSQQQKARLYYHHDPDLDIEEDFWPIMGILITILVLWTGFVHFIDWATLNVIPWWAEPFTIVPVVLLIVMKERFDSLNPLHWWPMFWGYRVTLPSREVITIRPLDQERIMKKHGGMRNVHIVDFETLKFRRRKDAVMFTLMNS
tara:strand:+ start:1240 stop:1677 length:438 start_codon:yes stop_codon:yes gene_type:complete